MITLVDIKRAIIKKLKSKYPDHSVYGEHVGQDFNKPSFSFYFVPIETTHSKFFSNKSLMVKIDYYTDSNDVNEANMIMIDELEQLFQNDLSIKDRYITINRTSSETVDNVLVFTLYLDYEVGNGKLVVVKQQVDGVEDDEQDEIIVEIDERNGYTEEDIKFMKELKMNKE